MWIILSLISACLLGLYDVCKKKALQDNGVLWVLFSSTMLSTLFLLPFFRTGTLPQHLSLGFKAALVTLSWVSGLKGMKYLPLTTVSTIKGSRPVFVVLFSIVLFRERLEFIQWAGVLIALTALLFLSASSKKDVSGQARIKGFLHMGVSVLSGVSSALYDKHILCSMEPLFVQSWTNLYISVLLAVCIIVKGIHDGKSREKFHWDPTLLLIAVLITISDYLYFHSLKDPGAMLSIISVIRRSSVLFTFIFGALFFHERNLKEKAFALILMLTGVALLVIFS